MADECVVCGEAEEGKPLYKKLGSGEFNVEVITALKALEMVNIPEASKNSSYICWDCDGLIVEQYSRYLQEQQEAAEVMKQTKKQRQQQRKKKKKPEESNLKLKISKDTKTDRSWGITKPKPQGQSTKTSGSGDGTISKTKRLEQQRAANAHHYSHCLMCDCNFETERRTYQRFSLKNRVNDDMDIAQVMELLGLARHIARDIKARRFVCNPCFVVIRRNYKDKLMKEAAMAEEAKSPSLPSTPASIAPRRSIHRATTEEHAAEIARLLPPGLAECYKIVTENPVNKKQEPVDTSQKNVPAENSCRADEAAQDSDEEEQDSDEEEGEEEEGALQVSQDEHGNYLIDIHDQGSPGGSPAVPEQEQQPAVPPTARRKKNVLLPRRMHKHLSLSPQGSPDRHSDIPREENGNEKEEEENKKASSLSSAAAQEPQTSRKCNVCGISIAGRPASWWHTLTSSIDGFDSISVTTALKLLETCLTSLSQHVQEDQPVCLPCYNKVSMGFKSQMAQKIARHRNIDVSEVNLSRVKVRTMPKEALEMPEASGLQERLSEAAESVASPMERPKPPMAEKIGEGEKENMDIERHCPKRKLSETNVLPDKRRKSVKNGGEQEASLDGSLAEMISPIKKKRPTHCLRAKNGKFLKKGANIPSTETSSVTEGLQQAESPSAGSQEDLAHTSQLPQETPSQESNENKESEPLVVLKDLRFVLPQEAFSGKAVSSHKIERIMVPPTHLPSDLAGASHSDLGTTTSPLQLVFSALSTYPPSSSQARNTPAAASAQALPAGAKVYGRCVVCGTGHLVLLSSWHSVEEDIRPPTLLVPVRWVCISLATCLAPVSLEDARLARVCNECFERLGDQFEEFVKRKVGESCGLQADAVDISEYLFTFNTETMNLEADPKQQSYIHEFEDAGQLLQRIQLLMEQFSVDEVVGEGKRQPLSEQHFCVWLLLVLNELRMQVGAAIGDLARWLVALMPVTMYESGVRPCPNNLATFLLSTTKCSKELTEDVLGSPIPAWVFVAGDTVQPTVTGEGSAAHGDEEEEDALCWEDFLMHVNLDALIGGRATPVSAMDFTQGLVYAVWRTAQLLGEGEQQVVDWLRQLSPLPLTKEQLENLVAMIGQLHNHLEEHPKDIHELECAIMPQLQNERCTSPSPSDSEEVVNTPPHAQADNSCVSEEESCAPKVFLSTPPFFRSLDSKKGKPNVRNTKITPTTNKKTPTMKNGKGNSQVKTPRHKKSKKALSLKSNMNAEGQNGDHSQRATIRSPQTTPSVGDKQLPLPSHPKNPTRDSGAPSDDTLATSKPDQDSFPTTKNSEETRTVTETLKEGTTNAKPKEDIAPIRGTSEETVTINRSSKESAVTSEHDEVPMKTDKSSKKILTTTEPPQEIFSTNGASGETIASINPAKETAHTSGTSKETADTSGTSKETADTSGTSKETADTSGTSKETAETSGVVKDTADTSRISKETAETSGTSKETAETSGTSKETADTSGTSKETAETSGTSKETAETSGTFKETAETSGTSKETAETSGTFKETAETSGTSKETAETSGTSKETADTSGTSKETAETSGVVKDTADTSRTSKETAETSGTFKETAETSGTSKETAETSGTSKKTAETSGTSKETAETSGTSKETAETSGTSKETAETSGTFKETAETSGTAQKTAEIRKSSLKTAETSKSSLKAAETSGTSKETVETIGTSKETVETSGTSKETAKTVGTSKETAKTVGTSKETAETVGTSKETVETSGISKETAETVGTSKETAKTVGTSKETAGIIGTSKETAKTVRTSKETAKTVGTSKETAETVGTSKETAKTVGTSKETAETVETSKETAETVGTSKETVETIGTSKETAETVGTSKETAETVGTSKETAETVGTSKETAETVGTSKETAKTSGTSKETAKTVGTPKETAKTVGTSKETAETNGISKEAAETVGTSKETAETSGTSKDTPETSGTSKDTPETVGTSKETAKTVGTSKETAKTVGTSKETAETSGTSKETAKTVGTSKETAKTVGTSKETAETSGTSKEIPETVGTSKETAKTVGTSKETAKTVGTSKEAAETSGTSKETAETSGISKEAAETSGTSKETPETVGTSKETAETSGTSKDTPETVGTSKDTPETVGTSKETPEASGTSKETAETSGTSKETAETSGTSKETAETSGTSKETAETSGTSKETAETSGTYKETAETSGTYKETPETVGTPKETPETVGTPRETPETVGTSKETAETSGTSKETAETNGTSKNTPETVGTSRETSEIVGTSRETSEIVGTSKETAEASGTSKETAETIGNSEEIPETCGIAEEPCEGTVSTDKFLEDITGTSSEPVDKIASTSQTSLTKILTKETRATNGASRETAATTESCEEGMAANGTSVKTAVTTEPCDGSETTNEILKDSVAANKPTNKALVNVKPTEEIRGIIGPCEESAASPVPPKGALTAHELCYDAKTRDATPTTQEAVRESSGKKVVKDDESESNVTTCVNSENTASISTTHSIVAHGTNAVIPTTQHTVSSPPTSALTLPCIEDTQVVLKKTNETSQNTTNILQIIVSKGPGTQTGLELRNEHVNLKRNGSSPGSKRTIAMSSKHAEMSKIPTKVRIVNFPKEGGNTPHQMEGSVQQSKDCIQMAHELKTDTHRKNSVMVVPSKKSTDIDLIPDKKNPSPQMPMVVQNTKRPLHRSERVCIKVFSTEEKKLRKESPKAESSDASKKGSVWLYQDPARESLKTEKVGGAKSSSSSSPVCLATLQEGREGNNNTEIPSVQCPKASPKDEGKPASVGHSVEKLKHTSKSNISQFEDTSTCTVQKKNEGIPVLNSTKHNNSTTVVRILGNSDTVITTSVKNVTNIVEDHCDQGKEDEVLENSVLEKNKTGRKYHKPVTPKAHKIEVHVNKPNDKAPDKSLVVEESRQSMKGKCSSSITKPDRTENKSSPGVTPSKPGAACRSPKGPPEKKQKLTFEQLMNYDLGHS